MGLETGCEGTCDCGEQPQPRGDAQTDPQATSVEGGRVGREGEVRLELKVIEKGSQGGGSVVLFCKLACWKLRAKNQGNCSY